MEWISPEQGNLPSVTEGTEYEKEIIIENYNKNKLYLISGELPKGINISNERDEETGYYYIEKSDDNKFYIKGKLDYVSKDTTYYFVLEALTENEMIQRWFSIKVETLKTKWNGVIYKCIKDQPYTNIPNWQSNYEYNIGDLVFYKNLIYKSKENQESSETFESSKWILQKLNEEYWVLYDSYNEILNWQSNYEYNIGDLVFYNYIIYRCIEEHTSNDNFDNDLWEKIIIENWKTDTEYNKNDLVIYNYMEMFEKQLFQCQYNLIDPEGNEVFKKISGELPEGITLSQTGLLYGVPEEKRNSLYNFRIGVYRGEEEVDKSDILSIKVKDINELVKPIWITDAGVLASINYDENGNENAENIYVVAYDFSGKKVYYELIDKNLPQGLNWYYENNLGPNGENSTNTGIIYGTCKTNVIKNDWFIKLQPYVINENNEKIYGDERTFTIITNAIKSDKLIKWVTESLDPVKIGYTYSLQLEVKCSDKVNFELVSGELPKGLSLNKNGEIYGIVDYQDLKGYEFYVKAYTLDTFSIKKFIMTVQKGLSKKAVDVFLYINKEYQEEYQSIFSMFDRTSAYKPYNKLYKIPSSPIIYIGTLNTYDKILLKKKMEQFNTPIEIFMKETKKKQLPDYDFFYKDFNEVNKKSKEYELFKHDDERDLQIENNYNKSYYIGYDRNNCDNVGIEFQDLDKNPLVISVKDGNTISYITAESIPHPVIVLSKLNDKVDENVDRYIYYTYNDKDEVVWYYVDLTKTTEGIVVEPVYTPINKAFDNVKYGREYVRLYDDPEKKVYVREVPKDTYYVKKTGRIVQMYEPIYIQIKTINNEKIIRKYILDDTNTEMDIDILNESTYVTYNPSAKFDEKTGEFKDYDEKIIKPTEYNQIEKEDNEISYYTIDSDIISFKTASIEGIRDVLSESFKVEKNDKDILYKVGNQEIVDIKEKDEDINKSFYKNYKQVYNIFKINDKEYIAKLVDDESDERTFYIYTKLPGIDELKEVYYKNDDDEYIPLIQREFILDGNIDNVFYTIYKKDSNIPFTHALFNFINNDIKDFWQSNYEYKKDDEVIYNDLFYKCNREHISTNEFNEEFWINQKIENTKWNESCKKYVYEKENDEISYAWFEVKEIKEDEKIYIYKYGNNKDIVLPYIEDEDVKEYVNDDEQYLTVQFLNKDEEKYLLPEYMRSELPNWQSNYEYKVNDEVIYNNYVYKCISKHTSSTEFNESMWKNEGYARDFSPMIPLYYAISYSHDTALKNINAYEKEGNFWYDRKMFFYEVHFEPKYEDADTFTIDFYNHVNENSPEFKLI